MPILDPRDTGYKPRDWRFAYDEFLKLKALVQKYKIPTTGWRIEFPSKVGKMVDQRWKLYATNLGERHITMFYIGHDGRTAEREIKRIREVYQEWLMTRAKIPTGPPKTAPKDPRQDPNIVRHMQETWNAMLVKANKAKSMGEWDNAIREHPEVAKFMKMKAGILDISMQEYLSKHPMSVLYPTPPMTERQYQDRVRAMEQHARDVEQANRDRQSNGWY